MDILSNTLFDASSRCRCVLVIMVNEISDIEYGQASASELSENKLRHNFRLGDITWVKQGGSSWWPAQVIDEACVGSKPEKKAKHDCLVRLYGTCQYLYIDPWKSNTEFKMALKQQNKSAMEVFREVLEKDMYRVDSSSDYDEEADHSEGTQTNVTSGKTSSRKIRKQEGLKQSSYKGVKKPATTENLEDDSENQDQEVGSTATTGTVQKAKRRRGRKSNSSHDTAETTDKDSCDNSAESLRGKRQKRVVQSVVKREGLRRSARPTAKEYLDACEDKTASFTDTDAGEDATEDSMVHETSAPHTEIKAMVRDILFKEIIDREHDAEMAYVDEVINGICNSTDSMTFGATGSTKGGQGMKQNGTGAEGGSSNVTQKQRTWDQTAEVTKNNHNNSLKEVIDTTPSRDAAMKEPAQLSPRQMRQIRIMQSLGLIAPSGSPFGKNTVIAATRH
ncbi:hypothetical protein EJB05_48683 [Eragrostis curvula]|uniref:PWWP domain-containing protein n=1 Tax=Eragrostis curvula TaxID=38414 RepID=A0A5J9T2T7_9POAL|nr:hypothetical protein EJB05_48683 [Eragrostis curvula]